MKTLFKLLVLMALVRVAEGAMPLQEAQLAQVAALYQQEGTGWPGLKWSEAPLAVSFGDGRFYALGLEGEGLKKEGAFVVADEDRWGLSGMKMHPAAQMDGQEGFYFKMSGENAVKILAHERFHRYQISQFAGGEETQGYKQHLNSENVALMGLEEALLREFVQQGNLESVKEYAAVHAERVKLLDRDSLAWEEMQLRFEGMADYVAAKMLGEERSVLVKESEGTLVENAMKWRHYGVGAALGLALDSLKVKGWQEKVEQGASLNDLLQNGLGLNDEEQKALVKKAKTKFSFKRKKKKVAAQVEEYVAKIAALKEEHDKKPGTCVKVGSLPGVGISGGGRSTAIYYLEDGSQVSVKDQSISQSMDGRWQFVTKEPSTLYQAAAGYREVKAAEDLIVKLDGKDLVADAEPREYLFESIELQAKDLQFKAEQAPGVLVQGAQGMQVWFFN